MANTDADRRAFDLALATMRRESPVTSRHYADRLAAGESYEEVGKAAAYHCQIQSLGLAPWMSPPCYPTMSALNEPYGDVGFKREIAELAMRMCHLRVSRWHPDPATECDRIEAEQRATAK